jgi:hypothetical protein
MKRIYAIKTNKMDSLIGLSDDCLFLVLEKCESAIFFRLTCERTDYLKHLRKKEEAHILGCCCSSLSRFKLGDSIGIYEQDLKEYIVDGQDVSHTITNVIAHKGNLEILKYALEKGHEIDEGAIRFAADRGDLEMVKFTHSNSPRGQSSFFYACIRAARNGHLEIIKYAKDKGLLAGGHAYGCSAAIGGQLEVIKYLDDNGGHLDSWTFESAAKGGHLEILKYLHENGILWNHRTCSWAASNGHLDCLRYAHENGCPWTGLTLRYALESNHMDCWTYARDNGCPSN